VDCSKQEVNTQAILIRFGQTFSTLLL